MLNLNNDKIRYGFWSILKDAKIIKWTVLGLIVFVIVAILTMKHGQEEDKNTVTATMTAIVVAWIAILMAGVSGNIINMTTGTQSQPSQPTQIQTPTPIPTPEPTSEIEKFFSKEFEKSYSLISIYSPKINENFFGDEVIPIYIVEKTSLKSTAYI